MYVQNSDGGKDGRADIPKKNETRHHQFEKLSINKIVSIVCYFFSSCSIHRQLNYLLGQVSYIAVLNCIFKPVHNYFHFVENFSILLY